MAVPPFERQVPVLQLDQRVTEQVRAELARRAEVTVQAAREGADAVLLGILTHYAVVPVSYDSQGRANRYQVSMTARLKLSDASGRTLYESEGYRFSQNYGRSPSPGTYVDEERVAYDIVARDFARSLVGRIMEADLSAGTRQSPAGEAPR